MFALLPPQECDWALGAAVRGGDCLFTKWSQEPSILVFLC